jgi:hypothetical protein
MITGPPPKIYEVRDILNPGGEPIRRKITGYLPRLAHAVHPGRVLSVPTAPGDSVPGQACAVKGVRTVWADASFIFRT